MTRGVAEYLRKMTGRQLWAFFEQKSRRIKAEERRRLHGSISETLAQECALMETMSRVIYVEAVPAACSEGA